MSGDWIKMRVWIRKDPRVASMADFLANKRAFMDYITNPVQRTCKLTIYEHITSDITRAITGISLLEIWGVARERGNRENDDLVLKHCDIFNLDDICGTPCMGEAMEYVDWAVQEKTEDIKGRNIYCVRFPNFFKDNESPEDRYKRQHAEAQARYREKNRRLNGQDSAKSSNKNSDITSDITVTPREEKRREDIKELSINKQTLIDTKKKNGLVAEKQETKKDRKPRVPADLVNQIFEDWKAVLLHPSSKLGKKRGDVIREAVRMGYKPEQMHEAFIGCARSSFHAGFNEQGKKYDDIELILRNEKNIDRFIAYAAQPPKPTFKPEDNTTLNVRREATKYYESACEDARCGIDIVGTGTTIDAESWEVLQPNLAH